MALTRKEVFEHLDALLRQHLQLDADEPVTEASSVVDDLGADSLDVVELAMAAEDDFGVRDGFADGGYTTVGTLLDLIMQHNPSAKWQTA